MIPLKHMVLPERCAPRFPTAMGLDFSTPWTGSSSLRTARGFTMGRGKDRMQEKYRCTNYFLCNMNLFGSYHCEWHCNGSLSFLLLLCSRTLELPFIVALSVSSAQPIAKSIFFLLSKRPTGATVQPTGCTKDSCFN